MKRVRMQGHRMNSLSFGLLIVLVTWATTCAAQAPCQFGRLVNMLGKQCMLGKIVFAPFENDYGPVSPEILFQPDAGDPDNPGFMIGDPFGPVLSVDSTFDPSFPFPNEEAISIGYTASLPCSGAVCETIFAPAITAITAGAENYSIDFSGFPAGFGNALSTAVHQAFGVTTLGVAACNPGGNASITSTAGEQLDNESAANDITWGPANSAAFQCAQQRIEGQMTAVVNVSQCATCSNLSTASLGSAIFYFHTRTKQAFLNGDTGGGDSQPLPRTVSPVVAFSAFSTKLQATSSGFQLASTFTLGNTSGGIDPLVEPTTLRVGPYAVALPAQSFHMTKKGYYVYEGTIDGQTLQLQIVQGATSTFTLKAQFSTSTPGTLENPTLVALTIGNDFGAAFAVPGN